MPTDNERREVAARLRAVAKKLGQNMDAHEFAHYTADVLDVGENMTWYEMELRLADLIEPSCDRDALLALAEELSSMRPCEVFDRRGAAEISRRIREEIGVKDEDD